MELKDWFFTFLWIFIGVTFLYFFRIELKYEYIDLQGNEGTSYYCYSSNYDLRCRLGTLSEVKVSEYKLLESKVTFLGSDK